MKHKISLMLLSSSLAINNALPIYAIDINNPINTDDAELAVLRDTSSGDGISIISDEVTEPLYLSAVATISLDAYNKTYTGEQIRPDVNVTLNSARSGLIENQDYTITYGENINVGTGSVVVTGIGEYTGSTTINFTISNKVLIDISNSTVSGIDASYTYRGNEIEPTPIFEGITPTYDITYNSNTDAGNASVIIKGNGDYTGTIVRYFTINKASISNAGVTNVETSYDYIGSAINPVPAVSLTGFTNFNTLDYTVSYGSNINVADDGTITINGTGNFEGSKVVNFTINQVSVNDEASIISGVEASYDYTGNEIKPEPTVIVRDRTLTKGVDYDVDYTSNIDVDDTAIITITGKGNYKDINNSTTFDIDPISLETASVTGLEASYTYTGSKIEPNTISVALNNKILELNTDYEIIYGSNKETTDTGTVTINGKDNYSGSINKTFSIVESSLSEAVIGGISASYTYDDGNAIKPEPTSVTLNGKTLVEDQDYTLSHGSNINVADGGTVILTGINNYSGSSASTSFIITPKDLNNVTGIEIESIDSEDYTGSPIEPSLTVNGTGLTASDYDISYTNNTNAGNATATITGTGNYTGSKSANFTITPISLSGATINGIETSYTYNDDNEIKPEPTSVVLDGKALVEGTDYEVSYDANTAIGTAKVIITGKNNYDISTTAEKTFSIVAKSITDFTINEITDEQVYDDGNDVEPSISITGLDTSNYTVSYRNNIDVGSAFAIATGTNTYSGSIEKEFSITAKSISGATITIDNQAYTGSQIRPSILVESGGATLTENKDYTITSYGTNINAGDGTVTITGKGNYDTATTAEKTFTITPISLSGATINGIETSYNYTGDEIEPVVISVVLNNKILELNTDYKVSYDANTNLGTNTAKVIITGIGNYVGSSTEQTFSIVEGSLSGAVIGGIEASYTYNDGNAIEPEPTSVTLNGKTLVEDQDYTLSHGSNINVADGGTVILTGINNYSGSSASTSFIITPKDLNNVTGIEIESIDSEDYTGSPIEPSLTVNGTGLTASDYDISYANNTNAGNATATITGTGNYTGSKSANFTIDPISLSGAVINGISASYTYNDDNEIKPEPTSVVLDGKALVEGTDYEVSYDANTAIGTAKIIITGKNNYYGSTAEKTFSIEAKSITDFTINEITAEQVYAHGDELKPSISITDLDASNYIVSYSNNINVGTALAIATGTSTYGGSISQSFSISEFEILTDHVSLSSTSLTYTSSPIEPDISVSIGSVDLVEDRDYIVAYSNNTNVSTDTAVATVRGIGNYTGTINKKFDIVAIELEDLEDEVVITAIDDQTYKGSKITPVIEVKIGENILDPNVDYSVSYGDNLNVGDDAGTVTVVGKGIYSGELASATFNIVQAVISNDTAIITPDVLPDKDYIDTDKDEQNFTVTVGGRLLAEDVDYEVSYSDTTGVGTVTVTISATSSETEEDGKGNYTGSVTRTFNINTLDINHSTVGASIDTIDPVTYTGSAITPTPVVTGTGLTDSNYDVSWSNNTNAGTATVTITGKGIYSGSVSKDFVINKASVIGASITGVTESETYTGEGITQDNIVVKVTVDTIERELTKNVDYTVSYNNNVNVGEATIIITGIGNYTGLDNSSKFEIKAKVLEDLEDEVVITGLDGSPVGEQTYKGSKITPDVIVKIGETVLEKGVHYIVTYGDNLNAGDDAGSITITGIGIYSDELASTNFDITPVSVVVDAIPAQTYTGVEITPTVVVKATVNGYTQTLEKDTHYEVTYDNNIDRGNGTGEAIISVTDTNFTGSTTEYFDIVATSVNSGFVIVDPINDKNFTGSSIMPTGNDVVVRNIDSTVLNQGTSATDISADYYLTYETNTDVGTGTVYVNGINAYIDTYTANFNINRTNIADSTITIMPIESVTYTGLAIEPTGTDVVITTDGGIPLTQGTSATDENADYYLTYGTNKDVGSGTVNIIGINDYSGSITKNFTIERINLSDSSTNASIDTITAQDYTGSEVKPTPKVTANVGTTSDKVLTENVDFSFTYSNNINSGTTGTGIINAVALANSNFSGAVSSTFTIGSGVISKIEPIPDQTYTGSVVRPTLTVLDENNKVLTAGTDYTISYEGDEATKTSGTVTVIVTATTTGNYTGGPLSTTFNITKPSLADTSIVLIEAITAQDYTRSALSPTPTVTLANGNALDNTGNKNYVTSWINNTNVGTATLTITATATGDYSGSQSKDFNIKAVDINTLTIDDSNIDNVAYTGLSHSPEVNITHITTDDLVLNQDYTVTYSNNTNIGQATVTIQGINNYTGSVVKTFNIGKIDLSNVVNIELASSLTPSYTGEELEPTLKVKLGSDYLFKDVDYTVVYSDNIEAGTDTATATITGIGNYTGTETFDFTINQAEVSKIDPIPNQIYTSDEIKPESDITVKSTIGGIDKIIGTSNYGLSYTSNTNAGDATVTAEATKVGSDYTGNYKNSATTTFKILKNELADAINVGSIDYQSYTGDEIEPIPVITAKPSYTVDITTDPDDSEDYAITYNSNINEGTAKVIITAKSTGKYTGSVETSFQIIKNNLSDAVITISPDNYDFTTNAIELTTTGDDRELKVVYGSGDSAVTLEEGTDFTVSYSNNINVGTATVNITGIGKYSGTNSKNFTINGFDITSVTNIGNQFYSGSALTPALEVKDGDDILELNKDYTAEYSNNINVGTSATVIVKGIGLYENSDSITKTFEIKAFDVPLSAIETIGEQAYTGAPIKPNPTIRVTTADGIERTLVAGTDYDITWDTNTSAGDDAGEIYIVFKGNYSGAYNTENSNPITFDIVKANLSSAISVGTIANQTYTGSQIKPNLSITANTGYTVNTSGNSESTANTSSDYTITYDDTTGTNKGTAKITIASKNEGLYTGSIDVFFEIVEKSITASSITIDPIASQAYTGSNITIDDLLIKDGDDELTEDEHYSLAYSNNTDVGMATITITGMGDYSGSRTINFSITALSIDDGNYTVDGLENSYDYTGSAIEPNFNLIYKKDDVDDEYTLVKGVDYTVSYSSNNLNVSTAETIVPVTITIKGIGKYSGEITKTFTIDDIDLTSSGIEAIENKVYTGSAINPEPVVTAVVSGVTKTLTKGTDYTLSYDDDDVVTPPKLAYIDEGSHVVTVKGIGNYSGSVNVSFTIVKTDISDIIKVEPITNQAYTGSAIKPSIVASLVETGDSLTEDVDYTLSYHDNTDLGTAKITINPITTSASKLKDYKNTFDVFFEIVVRSITDSSIALTNNITNQVYTSSELTPDGIELIDNSNSASPYTLEKDKDYILSYTNNINVGTATVTITGIGNYSGTRTVNFSISALSIDDGNYTVDALDASYKYTGSAIEPIFNVIYKKDDVDDKYTLVKGVDYTVSFANNIESSIKSGSSATITITGIGKYTGVISGETFSIEQATITRINPVEDQAYTGNLVTPAITVYADVNGIEKVLDSTDYKTPVYTNNTNPSTSTVSAEISVSALDSNTNYTGSAIKTYFRIIQTALTDVITVDAIPNQVYTSTDASTGITLSSTTPADLVVRLDGTLLPLVEDTDYTTSYLNNTSEGTATVIITPKAGGVLELYSGTHSETFRIVRNDIADADIDINPTSYDATGNAIELTTETTGEGENTVLAQLVVKYDDVLLVKEQDYAVTYSNNINAGNATIIINGIGDYSGSVNRNFLIKALTLPTIDSIDAQTYTGEPITPPIVMTDSSGYELVKDLDYTIGYSSNNINVTTNSSGVTTLVTVTATGIGKYAGSTQTQTFAIEPVTILSSGVEAIPDQTYTKSPIEPDIKVMATLNMQEVLLTEDVDYTIDYTGINHTDAGTGVTPIITGIGNYAGTPTASFNIVKTAINDASITISPDPIQDQTYTQDDITIDDLKLVSIVNGILTEADNADYNNNDYTIDYADNVNIGTAKITISATADSLYSGSKVLYFNIVQKSVADLIIEPIANQTFTGSALTPSLVIKDGDYTLDPDAPNNDYSVSYVDNINAGTATVIITGTGKYGGTISQNFIINPIDFSADATKADISVSDETYTGTDILPTIVVTSKAGVTLIKDEDYTVGYNNNIVSGLGVLNTASVTINGINNYTGTLNETFTINQAEITSIDPIADKSYTGSIINIPDQEIIVRSVVGGSSQILVKDRDYTVNQDLSTLVGIASISVNGIGNYKNPASGEVSQNFNITRYTLADVVISPIPDQLYNNGLQVQPSDSNIVVRTTEGTLLTKSTDGADGDYIIKYGANTTLGSNAGTITIEPSTDSLYAGSQTVSFNITQTDISNPLFANVASIPNETYAGGTSIEPAVNITLLSGGATLTQSTDGGTTGDYTVSYSNNINKGTATATITGINNYSGIVTREFTIDPADLATANYSIGTIGSQIYTSNAITPTITIENTSGNRLILNTDYTVGYTDNTNVGSAIVNVTGTGNYTGTLTQNFAISPATIIRVETIENQAYTGSDIEPEVVVVALLNGVEIVLTKGTHYTIAYENNINETTSSSRAKVTVTPVSGGNYTGTHVVYFDIVKMSVNDPSISLTPSPIPDQYYTGSDIIIDDLALKSIVDSLETTLVQSTDGGTTGDYKVTYSNNLEVGTANILIEGINYYTGSRSITFNIGKVSITDPTITIDSIPNQVYTGSAITPDLNIKHIVDGIPIDLVKDQDYTVVFNSNTEVGTATVVITGIGKYTGSVSKTFNIESFNLSTAIITPIADQVYTGESITPLLEVKITVDSVEYTLVKDIDYTVGFTNNVEVGTSTVTISGIGKYTGTNSASFEITPITIQEDGITPNPIPDQAYAGMAEVKPDLLVKATVNGLEKILTENLDYTLTYFNNRDMGTASVTVAGINNFTHPKDALENSELVFDFEILKTDLADTTLVIVDNIPNQIYQGDGVAITPTLRVTLADGTPLVLSTDSGLTGDYTVSYSNNTGVGTATATITAVTGSYYTGSRSIDFEIVKSDISDPTFATITPNVLQDSIYIGTNVNYDSDIAITLVSDGSTTLVQDLDYTISYDDNINAGLVTVTISGIGLYSGTVTKTFTINPIVLTTGLIDSIPDQEYTGTFITPPYPDLTINQVLVNGSPVTLVLDQDYTIEYTNNIEPGTGTLTLTGIGNYTGVLKETFLINKKDVNDTDIKITIVEPTYTGSEIELDAQELIIVRKGSGAGGADYTLVENTDFTVTYDTSHTEADEVKITISGINTYTGSITKYFDILTRDIDLAVITPNALADEIYTGSAIMPDVTNVSLIDLDGLNSTNLVLGTEYDISYSNNTEIGTATVTLTGKGNYSSTATFDFEILPIPVTTGSIEVSPISGTYTYNGEPYEPRLTVKDKRDGIEGITLNEGEHYTVEYTNNINAGTATAIITGIGIYDSITYLDFTISAKALAIPDGSTVSSVSGINNSYQYTGSEIKPDPVVVIDNVTLVRAINDDQSSTTADYYIEYSNNINPPASSNSADQPTLKIIGMNNYEGSVEKTFTIYSFDMSSLLDIQEIESLEENASNLENTEETTSSLDNTEENTSNLDDAEENTSNSENTEENTSNLDDAEENASNSEETTNQEENTNNTEEAIQNNNNLSNVLNNFLSSNLSNLNLLKNKTTNSTGVFSLLSNLFKK